MEDATGQTAEKLDRPLAAGNRSWKTAEKRWSGRSRGAARRPAGRRRRGSQCTCDTTWLLFQLLPFELAADHTRQPYL